MNEDITFDYGNTYITGGCAATLKGEFWYFAGKVKLFAYCIQLLNKFVEIQAYKIVGCGMEHQPDASVGIQFSRGSACQTFNQPEPKVLLCFGYAEQNPLRYVYKTCQT